jgi:NADPH-dependent 2,4-dienoyl-CoA reductase/sulfur reductase-like enzyme
VGGDRVVYLRTLADQRRLRDAPGRRVVVIGGGFIGSELAAAMAGSGREVTLVLPEEAVGARRYPAALAEHLTRTFREKRVRVLTGERVVEIGPAPGQAEATRVLTAGGVELVADAVAAGLGIDPDLPFAAAAGLRCGDGIVVNERLETSAPSVFAAGDVARFPCPALGGAVRFEHEDAAVTMGRTAGRNMAGAGESYTHLPFFYSDLFDLGYEAVGRLDARLETVVAWRKPFREGIVYYLEADRVRGVLLWGIFGRVDEARALITGESRIARDTLAEAIPP